MKRLMNQHSQICGSDIGHTITANSNSTPTNKANKFNGTMTASTDDTGSSAAINHF